MTQPVADWSAFPHGYSLLLNEKAQFPHDLANWRLEIDTSHQLFVDTHLIAAITGLERRLHPAVKHDANPLIRDFVSLAGLDDLVFGGWDPISANVLEAAQTCGVLEERDLAPLSAELEGIVAMDAVFDQRWVKKLEGARVKPATSKWDQAQALVDDIERFRSENDCERR